MPRILKKLDILNADHQNFNIEVKIRVPLLKLGLRNHSVRSEGSSMRVFHKVVVQSPKVRFCNLKIL